MHHKSPFVAIDFETADYGPDSAFAVALLRVEGSRIVARRHSLIRPPRQRFVFSCLHGIIWEMVAGEPTFCELWPELNPLIADVKFLSAHNASFDRGVLHACCAAHGFKPPGFPSSAPSPWPVAPGNSIPPSCPTSVIIWGFPWTIIRPPRTPKLAPGSSSLRESEQ